MRPDPAAAASAELIRAALLLTLPGLLTALALCRLLPAAEPVLLLLLALLSLCLLLHPLLSGCLRLLPGLGLLLCNLHLLLDLLFPLPVRFTRPIVLRKADPAAGLPDIIAGDVHCDVPILQIVPDIGERNGHEPLLLRSGLSDAAEGDRDVRDGSLLQVEDYVLK